MKMTTIKVEPEARDALRKLSAMTGEKQYAIISRLVLQEKTKLRLKAKTKRS